MLHNENAPAFQTLQERYDYHPHGTCECAAPVEHAGGSLCWHCLRAAGDRDTPTAETPTTPKQRRLW